MKQIRQAKKKKGFNLIEVIIAMAVLVFALISIYSIFIRGSSDIDYGKRKTIATRLAEEKLEELRSYHFSDSLLAGGNDEITMNNSTFKRKWKVTDIDPNLKKIQVKVEWRGRSIKQNYSISTKKRKF